MQIHLYVLLRSFFFYRLAVYYYVPATAKEVAAFERERVSRSHAYRANF